MGVTLERVQFKFASIIGELCSEPDILSQFAVWVDLRLAEYKLKGSISLDCSGDTPDPVWLKGILSALFAKRLAKRRDQSNPASHGYGESSLGNGSYSYMSSPMSRTQRELSRDETGVGVKEEPCEDGVFPVKFHKNQTVTAHRKRLATESVTGEEDSDILYSHSTPKQRRSESTAQASNESLMSIIGVGEQQDNADMSYDNIKDTIDLIVESEETENTGQEGSNMSSSIVYHTDDRAASTSQDRLHDNSFTSPNPVPMVGQEMWPPGAFSMHQTHHSRMKPSDRNAGAIPNKNAERYRKQTLSYVRRFEDWLKYPPRSETRSMLELPVDMLDQYLADYFWNLRTDDGRLYGHDSLVTLRSVFGRYLMQNNYQHSIRSPEFHTVHRTFREIRQRHRSMAGLQNMQAVGGTIQPTTETHDTSQTGC